MEQISTAPTSALRQHESPSQMHLKMTQVETGSTEHNRSISNMQEAINMTQKSVEHEQMSPSAMAAEAYND